MPTVGEIKKGKDIGKTPRNYFLWGACPKCGKERWVQLLKSKDAMHRLCRNCGNLGHPAYNWKGGRTKDDRGYIRISTNPKDFFYPMASSIKDGYGYIFEHRLVMAKHLGRCLQSWELVHHKGERYPKGSKENKSDNRLENLQLIGSEKHNQLTILESKISRLENRVTLLEADNALLREQVKGYECSIFYLKQLKEILDAH